MPKSTGVSTVEQEVIKEAFNEMEKGECNKASIKRFKEELLHKDDEPIGSFVGGSWMHSIDVGRLIDPVAKRVITEICVTNDDISRKAIESATAASKNWCNLSSFERSRHMLSVLSEVEKKKDLFVAALTCTTKLSTLEALDCVSFLIQCLNHFSSFAVVNEATKKLKPSGVMFIVSYEDVFQMFWHICAALAFGNVVIFEVYVKHSLPPLMLAVIMHRCGIPAGVFNVLPMKSYSIISSLQLNVPKNTRVFINGSLNQCQDVLNSCKSVDVDWTLLTVSRPAILILEDSDIDSAVNATLDSIKSEEFRSVACIFVQECVCDKVCNTIELYFENLEIVGTLEVSDTKTEIQITHGDFVKCVPLIKFRSAKEAVDLFNAGSYEAVSIWCEKLSLSLELAKKVKAGVIWINSINTYHPAAFGRKSIKGSNFLSMYHFMRREAMQRECNPNVVASSSENHHPHKLLCGMITYNFFYEGVFNDSNTDTYKFIRNYEDKPVFCVPEACKKDILNAISSAVTAKSKWKTLCAFERSQQLHELADKLKDKEKDFADALKGINNRSYDDCMVEVRSSVQKIRYWAAYCLQLNGCIEQTQSLGIVWHYLEPSGVIAIVCPEEYPLLSFISLFAAAIALGNVVVMFPSVTCPTPAFHVCEVLRLCNIAAGVINVIYSSDKSMVPSLIEHKDVNSVWIPSDLHYEKAIKQALSETLKHAYFYSYFDDEWNSTEDVVSRELTFHSVSSKVVWLPDGDIFP